MKPLRTLIICGTSLALIAAASPSMRGALLNAAFATAWAQQDRGRDGKSNDREERDQDKDKDKDRDTERGDGDKHRDRDKDRGGGHDKESKERDHDRGSGATDQDRDMDRGGANDKEGKERDHDQSRGNERDREGGNDRGNSNDRGNGNDRGDGDADPGDRNGNDDRSAPSPDADDRNGSHNTPGSDNDNHGGVDIDLADRGADPAERATGANRDGVSEALAGRFDLDDTETFDNDGFLARRGEIIAMSTDALLRRRAEALGLEVIQQEVLTSLNTTMYRLSVPAAAPIDGILARLRAQDPHGVFDRNHLYDRSGSLSASSSGAPLRALANTAKGVRVGLIDTGVDALHPALAGTNVELNYLVDSSRALPEAHGTAVVSLLVSPEFGVLPDAQLYVACVFYEDRRGGSLSEARDLVRALDWLMKRGVPVINMSLAGPPNEVLHAVVKRALGAGHLIVAAVGNGGPASPPLYPAAYEGVIAVTAVDAGNHVYRRANRGSYVQLSAMGVDVVAAAPTGTATYSGTSFASPYVAALAAMDYRSLDPQKVLAVKQGLQENALDLGPPGRDEVYGFGLARPRTVSTVAR